MKKMIALLLAIAAVLSLCACGGGSGEAQPQKAAGLQVGYAREKIMPEASVPMAGYTDSSSRMSTGYVDYLYATCIAFTEGEETVLMFSQDLFKTDENWTAEVRERIAAETGVPGDRVMICSTHNHAGPDISSNHSSITGYKMVYMDALTAAAKAALADRAAATLYSAETQTEKLNFPRHYILSDGSYGGDNFGDFTKNSITGYANDGDPEMLLVKVDREGEKKDILLMNWQAYACKFGTANETNLSADFIAPARDTIEAETGMLFAYFNGAAGDIKPASKITEDNGKENVKEYGNKLAGYAIAALETMKPVAGNGVKVATVEFEYAVNHDDEDKLSQAKEVVQVWQNQSMEAAGVLAKEYGFRSAFHAQQVTQRVTRPQSRTMELSAVYAGGIAFVAAPYEMFSATGLEIKEKSPFGVTMICSCANEYQGNFATAEAYDYGSYESDINFYAKGCAEAAAEKFLEMLNTMQ